MTAKPKLTSLIWPMKNTLKKFLGFPQRDPRVANPTPYNDPIVLSSYYFLPQRLLTLFGDSDFLLFEEADSFLAIEDDPTSPEVDPTYYDPDGDILLLEAILYDRITTTRPNKKLI
ncbi:hypothetical protein Tco_0461268 [Tanacetum coccineum]